MSSIDGLDGLDLGTFGVYTFDFEVQPAALIRDSAQELEELGWGALWVPELLGRDAFTHAWFLLAGTERMPIVDGIAQIRSRGPGGRAARPCCWPTPTPTGMCWGSASAADRGRARGASPWRP
ncbi:LLM class oxidoreductase [Streptomyces geranii]|uniref:hypothetical protein n=1 Tax=Streptomyces geranii TaxID=2058923 RepID=UPI0018E5818A|nr:hypothetical protein [Streptomyces geranii]